MLYLGTSCDCPPFTEGEPKAADRECGEPWPLPLLERRNLRPVPRPPIDDEQAEFKEEADECTHGSSIAGAAALLSDGGSD